MRAPPHSSSRSQPDSCSHRGDILQVSWPWHAYARRFGKRTRYAPVWPVTTDRWQSWVHLWDDFDDALPALVALGLPVRDEITNGFSYHKSRSHRENAGSQFLMCPPVLKQWEEGRRIIL